MREIREPALDDLRREAEALRVRLAHLEAAIKRREHELWQEYQRQRDEAIRTNDAVLAATSIGTQRRGEE